MNYQIRSKLLALEDKLNRVDQSLIIGKDISNEEAVELERYLFIEGKVVCGINWLKLKTDWAIWLRT